MQSAAVYAEQDSIDSKNSVFWNELCGTGLAKMLGISDFSEASLKIFDDWYFNFYPYLKKYLNAAPQEGVVLEIGLGYGTASGYLAKRVNEYHAIDIAKGPVELVNLRLEQLGKNQNARVGSAHALPHENEKFDAVVSIGCFHHTGSIQKCVNEAYRVLKPGGVLVFMCYNRRSIRMLKLMPIDVFFKFADPIRLSESGAALYDANAALASAPFTEIGSAGYYKKLCSRFSESRCYFENWEGGRRDKRLNTMAKLLGLDSYLICTK